MTTLTKSLAAAALACGLALSTATGASAATAGNMSGLKVAAPQSSVETVHNGRRFRNVGIGLLGTAAAVAVISGAARADGRRYRRGESCDYLDYKCSQGHGWACRKYEYRCED